MQSDIDKVRSLFAKATKFYWSPMLPENCVHKNPESKKPAGIGLIAHENYAWFNLAINACGVPQSYEDQQVIVEFWEKIKTDSALLEGRVGDYSVEEAATMLTQAEFNKWVKRYRSRLYPVLHLCTPHAKSRRI
jgi:hypothetical protein